MRKNFNRNWFRTLLSLFLAISLCLYHTPAFAQPNITGIDKTAISHKDSITISGSAFGTHPDNSPNKPATLALQWDDFETGVVGQRAGKEDPTPSEWYSHGSAGFPPLYANDETRPGSSVSVKQDLTSQQSCYFGLVNQNSHKFYISLWRYMHTEGAPTRNFKPLSLRCGPPGNWDFPSARHDLYYPVPENTQSGHIFIDDHSGYYGATWDGGGDCPLDSWNRMEYWVDAGDVMTANARMHYYRDGQLIAHWDDEIARATSWEWSNMYLSTYFAHDPLPTDPPGPQASAYIWLDDVYIDTTRARVEIGNAATWGQCTLREIQIPKSWSSSSITFTANQGSFTNGTIAYLYVVDENGNVNENGYAISFGTAQQAICGNNIKETNETCDGTALAGQTCQSRGYNSGALKCSVDCQSFDESQCVLIPSTVTRILPSSVNTGEEFTISLDIKVNNQKDIQYLLINEQYPSGFSIISVSENGNYTSQSGHIKWNLENVTNMTLIYKLKASSSIGNYLFNGSYMFFSMQDEKLVEGQNQMQVTQTTEIKPQITNAPSTIQHKQSITISGSGFGAHADNSPADQSTIAVKFDDFENGVVEQDLGIPFETPTEPNGWYIQNRGGPNPKYSNEKIRPGSSLSVKQDYKYPGQYNAEIGLVNLKYHTYYVSLYRYMHTEGLPTSNFKPFSLRGGSPGAWDPPGARHDLYFPVPENTQGGHLCGHDNLGVSYDNWSGAGDCPLDSWNRIEYYIERGDPNVSNGRYYYYRDGIVKTSLKDIMMASWDYNWSNLYLAGYFARGRRVCINSSSPHYLEDCGACADGSWSYGCYSDFCQGACATSDVGCTGRGGCNGTIYNEDIYIDITQARIELCNVSTWSKVRQGAHCEIQIPTEWSSNSINFKANQGSFANGATAYLYVVDENGNVNENGYAISFAAEIPQCSQGQITSTCLCGGVSHSNGYCCSNVWQSSACSIGPTTCQDNKLLLSSCLCGGQEVKYGYCCSGMFMEETCPRQHLTCSQINTEGKTCTAVSSCGTLSGSNKYFLLANDISSDGTCIDYQATSSVLDLNGYTIKFADGYGTGIPNGNFENGFTGWDISKAPGARIASTIDEILLEGEKSAYIPAGGEIVSDWVYLPKADKTNVAHVIASERSNVSISVENQNGETVCSNSASFDLGGGTVYCSFSGRSVGNYRVRVSTTMNQYLDNVDIVPSGYYGIDINIASSSGGVIKNGRIMPGSKTMQSVSIYNDRLYYQKIENLTVYSSGIESKAFAGYTNSEVKNNVFINDVPWLITRHSLSNYATSIASNTEYSYNLVKGGQGNLYSGGKSDIHHNVFRNAQTTTNHYSVALCSANSEVHDNIFQPYMGSGITLYGAVYNNKIYNNYFNITAEKCDAEYRNEDYTTNAIRFAGYSSANIHDNEIYNNVFDLHGKYYPVYQSSKTGCKPVANGIFDNSGYGVNNAIHDNTFNVYYETEKDEAYAFYISGNHYSTYKNNRITGNAHLIWAGGYYSSSANTIIENNTFIRNPGFAQLNTIKMGGSWSGISTQNLQFINNNFVNTDKDSITYKTGPYSFYRKWYSDVIAESGGQRVAGAEVIAVSTKETVQAITNSRGEARLVLAEIYESGSGSSQNRVLYTPHQVTVIAANGRSATNEIYMDSYKQGLFTLGSCQEGSTVPCYYEGPQETRGVGVCTVGVRTCYAGIYGACQGQQLPSTEVCNDVSSLDEDCDGHSNSQDVECTCPQGKVTKQCWCGSTYLASGYCCDNSLSNSDCPLFPVAYYRFENNVEDSSGNNFHGTPTSITYTTGISGNAANFSGNSYIALPTSLGSAGKTQRTWVGWFNTRAVSNSGFIVSEDIGYYWKMFIGGNEGRFSFSTRDSSSGDTGSIESISTPLPPSINQWHHFAAVYDSVNSRKEIWIDGEKVASTTSSVNQFTNTTPSYVTIGDSRTDHNYFNGMIDEVSIYNKALNGADIIRLYTMALQTCSQQNGKICLVGTTCNGTWIPALDADNCCKGSCIPLVSPENCTDGQRNQDETDIDCGGTKCAKCLNGKTCLLNSDCQSSYCNSSKICSQLQDTTPPIISNKQPTGQLASGTTSTTLSLNTDEIAECRYSTTANSLFNSMTKFTSTNSTNHSTTITGLQDGRAYSYYIKCKDTSNNTNSNDYTISFSIASTPLIDIKLSNSQAPGQNIINKPSWFYTYLTNIGTANATNINLTLYANNIQVAYTSLNINAGASKSVNLTWIPKQKGNITLRVIAIVSGDVNLSNNEQSLYVKVYRGNKIKFRLRSNTTNAIKRLFTVFWGQDKNEFEVSAEQELELDLPGLDDGSKLPLIKIEEQTEKNKAVFIFNNATEQQEMNITYQQTEKITQDKNYSNVFSNNVSFDYESAKLATETKSKEIDNLNIQDYVLAYCDSFANNKCTGQWKKLYNTKFVPTTETYVFDVFFTGKTSAFALVESKELDGSTTNITTAPSLADNLIFERERFGNILFLETVNITRIKANQSLINNNIQIYLRKIKVDTTILPELSKKARLLFKGIDFRQPKILKNGQDCSADMCNILSYDTASNELIVEVSSFSDYEVVEGYTAPVQQQPSGGGGGITPCKENWTCEYSTCKDGMQKLVCRDLKNCNTTTIRPKDDGKTISCFIEANCIDNDGDGYGIGPECKGEDADDNDPTINIKQTTEIAQPPKPREISPILYYVSLIILLVAIMIIIVVLVKKIILLRKVSENIE